MTIEEFGRKLRAREVTALKLTEACLRRIDELRPRLNAFIRVMADEARRDAANADRELAAGRDLRARLRRYSSVLSDHLQG